MQITTHWGGEGIGTMRFSAPVLALLSSFSILDILLHSVVASIGTLARFHTSNYCRLQECNETNDRTGGVL